MNKNITAKKEKKREIKKLEANEFLNSPGVFLKKSALADCIIPKETNGTINIKLLANKLNIPLSSGVRYFGLVNTNIKSSEMPLEKKLVNIYVATDL